MLIKTKELPANVLKVVSQFYNSKAVKLEAREEFKCPTNWHDANLMKLIALNTDTGELKAITSGYYDNYVNFTVEEKAMYHGGINGILTPNMRMILVETYPKSCTIFTHPDNVAKAITEPEEELSNLELKVLFITRSLISSARLEEARRFGIPRAVWLELQAGLYSKGYLMRTGALTLKGKNRAAGLYFNSWE